MEPPRNVYYPTEALPGTGEKIGVLTQRARRRWPRWHPADARLPDGTDPSALDVQLPPQTGDNQTAAEDGYRLYVETLNARRKCHAETRRAHRPRPRPARTARGLARHARVQGGGRVFPVAARPGRAAGLRTDPPRLALSAERRLEPVELPAQLVRRPAAHRALPRGAAAAQSPVPAADAVSGRQLRLPAAGR